MLKFARRKARVLGKIKRIAQFCAVLALPIGIDAADDNQADMVYGLYAGGGSYASIIEGCDSPPRSVSNSFAEGAAALYMRMPQHSRSPFVIGLMGGIWYSDVTLADWNYDPIQQKQIDNHVGERTFVFITPSIAIEGDIAAIGVGLPLGRYPARFNAEIVKMPHLSGHVRFGRARGLHLLTSLNENLPMNSGGGSFNFGVGTPIARKIQMYNGLSFGGYNGVGFTHQLRIPLNRNSALDVNIRWAPLREDTGMFEGGIGVGYRRIVGGF